MGLYGTRIESDRARSVVGSIENAPSGNVVLRIGRENGLGWEQSEYVVLERDEARALAAEIYSVAVDGEPPRPPVVLAPVDDDGARVDAPEPADRSSLEPFTIDHAHALRWIRTEHAERVAPDRFEIRTPSFETREEQVGHARALELLRIVSKPIPGRDGWRRSADGREWYSAHWLGDVA